MVGIMDPTFGAILAVAFPVVLCLLLFAFGKLSAQSD